MGIEAKNTTSVLRANYEKYLLAYEYFETNNKMAASKCSATDANGSTETPTAHPIDVSHTDTANTQPGTVKVEPDETVVDTGVVSANVPKTDISSASSTMSLDPKATRALGSPVSPVGPYSYSAMARYPYCTSPSTIFCFISTEREST